MRKISEKELKETRFVKVFGTSRGNPTGHGFIVSKNGRDTFLVEYVNRFVFGTLDNLRQIVHKNDLKEIAYNE